MKKMMIDMMIGSVLTVSTIAFLNSKEGKKLKHKISKMMM